MTNRGLDTFRWFAFLAVFLFHVELVPVGYLGVLAFFVLSGFLLTPILVDMRDRLPVGRYFLNFYGRRSLRIFPLYYFYLSGVAVLALAALALPHGPAALHQFRDQVVFAASYTYDFFHASRAFTHSPLLTHFWSLAVEEQFYLLWPLVILCVRGTRLKQVLLALVVAGPLIRIAQYAAILSFPDVFHHRRDMVLYVLPLSHIDAFAVGGYFALYGRTPSRTMVGTFAAALILLGLITESYAGTIEGLTFGFKPFMADSWKHVWGYTGVSLVCGWLLLLIRDRQCLPSLFERRWLAYLGKISYGLYVYHFAMIWVFSFVPVTALPGPAGLWRAVLVLGMLAFTVMISIASYTLLEAPLLRLKDKYFPTYVRPAAGATPEAVARSQSLLGT